MNNYKFVSSPKCIYFLKRVPSPTGENRGYIHLECVGEKPNIVFPRGIPILEDYLKDERDNFGKFFRILRIRCEKDLKVGDSYNFIPVPDKIEVISII